MDLDADGMGGGGGRGFLSLSPDGVDTLSGGGGGSGFSAPEDAAPVVPPGVPRLAFDSSGGGAPGFALDTKGGGPPPAERIPFAESLLFMRTGSRAGGGGARAGAATTGATGTTLSDRFPCCGRAPSLLPPFPPLLALLGDVVVDENESPALGDRGEAPALVTAGDGRSDTVILEGLCSPQSSAVSAMLLASPRALTPPAAELPGTVAASEASESCGGASS